MEMIIFEFLLTTWEAWRVAAVFSGNWGSSGNGIEPKSKPPCPNL